MRLCRTTPCGTPLEPLDPPGEAIDVGFIDEVVPADEVLDRSVEVAADMAATLDPSAYARTVAALRGDVLARMGAQLAADRTAGAGLA